MLREDIARIIRYGENFGYKDEELSLLLAFYLDNKLDLDGNGWFDDDELFKENMSDEFKYQEMMGNLRKIFS